MSAMDQDGVASESRPEFVVPCQPTASTSCPSFLSQSRPSINLLCDSSQQPMKVSTLARNNQRWEARKEAIHHFYMVEDHTLKQTMDHFQRLYNFKASERKWKEKVKGWKFEKHIRAAEMSFMAAKAEKRKLEQGKDTLFYRQEKLIDGNRIEHFNKKRLAYRGPSILASTPPDVTYSTPLPHSPSQDHNYAGEALQDDAHLGDTSQLVGIDGDLPSLVASYSPTSFGMNESHSLDQESTPVDKRVLSQTSRAFLEQARNYREAGRRELAEDLYLEALESMHTKALESDAILSVVEELRDYLSTARGAFACMSAGHCSKLSTLVSQSFIPETRDAARRVVATLFGLLDHDPCLPLHDIVCAAGAQMFHEIEAGDCEESQPLWTGFQNLLGKVLLPRTFPTMDPKFSLLVTVFSWELKSLFQAGKWEVISEGKLSTLRNLLKMCSGMVSHPEEYRWDIHPWEMKLIEASVTSISQALNQDIKIVATQASITRILDEMTSLSSIYSKLWQESIADAIFATIMKIQSLLQRRWENEISLHISYYDHLKRNREWGKLLSFMDLVITRISSRVRILGSGADLDLVLLAQVRLAKSTLRLFPQSQCFRHEPGMPSMEDLEDTIFRLETVHRQSLHSEILSLQDIIIRPVQFDVEYDDSKSHKYGTTYTESVSGMTGISFSYSDLWK